MKDVKELKTSISSLTTSMNNQMKELRDMMMVLMQSNKSPTPPPTSSPEHVTPGVKDPLSGASSGAEAAIEEEVDGDSKAKDEDGSEKYSAVPPPYSLDPPIPHPHIVHRGDPPKLTPKAFPMWQAKMKSYLCCSSMNYGEFLRKDLRITIQET